jgi:hypothetical protein
MFTHIVLFSRSSPFTATTASAVTLFIFNLGQLHPATSRHHCAKNGELLDTPHRRPCALRHPQHSCVRWNLHYDSNPLPREGEAASLIPCSHPKELGEVKSEIRNILNSHPSPTDRLQHSRGDLLSPSRSATSGNTSPALLATTAQPPPTSNELLALKVCDV